MSMNVNSPKRNCAQSGTETRRKAFPFQGSKDVYYLPHDLQTETSFLKYSDLF